MPFFRGYICFFYIFYIFVLVLKGAVVYFLLFYMDVDNTTTPCKNLV